MIFHSILFERPEDHGKGEASEAPAFFVDLNLNQLVDAVTAGKNAYNLKPFFYAPLNDIRAIQYRQEIMRDVESKALLDVFKSFAQKMSTMRRYLGLAESLDHHYNKEGWFLEAVLVYGDAVSSLAQDLSETAPKSRGLLAFRDFLTNYVTSTAFTSLQKESKNLKADLATVKYRVRIKEGVVRVSKYNQETDYSIEVENTFARFQQGAVKDYRIHITQRIGMNHIDAQIVNCVARFYPEIFSNLDRFCERHQDFLDETLGIFDREIQFYISYLSYLISIKRAGLKFCYPQISVDKEIYDYEGFDLVLANKLTIENAPVVCNDFYMKGQERILVITGPNQGGKTTFARTFGQLHYLAKLGCPVPGREAKLFLYDQLFTQFEKEEDIRTLRGKLADDLVRIHDTLGQATPNSIVIMNEVFSSTTLQDAVFLSKEIMRKLERLDLLCVFVTFMDELASFSEKTVSMVSTVVPENPAQRTYKLVRKPADGLAYAISIAEKNRLTYEQIKERLKP